LQHRAHRRSDYSETFSGSIVQWIAQWRKEGVHQFYFVDNTFNLPASYAKEICRQLIDEDLKIRWWSILFPAHVDEDW
jgi:hypothetical protein